MTTPSCDIRFQLDGSSPGQRCNPARCAVTGHPKQPSLSAAIPGTDASAAAGDVTRVSALLGAVCPAGSTGRAALRDVFVAPGGAGVTVESGAS